MLSDFNFCDDVKIPLKKLQFKWKKVYLYLQYVNVWIVLNSLEYLKYSFNIVYVYSGIESRQY